MWNLPEKDRWRLYRRWVYEARECCHKEISDLEKTFDRMATDLKFLRQREDYLILQKADVIGMTTTGITLL